MQWKAIPRALALLTRFRATVPGARRKDIDVSVVRKVGEYKPGSPTGRFYQTTYGRMQCGDKLICLRVPVDEQHCPSYTACWGRARCQKGIQGPTQWPEYQSGKNEATRVLEYSQKSLGLRLRIVQRWWCISRNRR